MPGKDVQKSLNSVSHKESMFKKIGSILLVALGLMGFLEAEQLSIEEQAAKKYQFSICTVFQNEEKFLKEWLEYHLLIGVEHFYLYDNGSRDRLLDVIRPYIEKGVVTLYSSQIPADETAAKFAPLLETKWLMLVKVSEFIVPSHFNKIGEILDGYADSAGVIVPIEFYDASRDSLPHRRLLIETAELLAGESVPSKERFKLIFKPELCEGFNWPCYEDLFKNYVEAVQLKRGELCLNHYLHRSKKNAEGSTPAVDKEEEFLNETNSQECVIHRYIPTLMKKLGFEKWDF